MELMETNSTVGSWGIDDCFWHILVEADFAEDQGCSKGLSFVEGFQ